MSGCCQSWKENILHRAIDMSNLFNEENQERLNELRKRSEPMFHEWARACHPFWSQDKVDKEAEWYANAYSECRQEQKKASESNEIYEEYAQDVLALFVPVVYYPFFNTFYYWCSTSLRERILTIDDLDISGSDILDSDALFAYLKKLEPEVRIAGYKNIGLHSVLQKRIEKTIVENDLSQFEDILFKHPSETDMFCCFFGRMANRVPDSSVVMELIKDQKKAYSLDAFKAIREFKRSIRHLPEEEKNVTVANFMYKSAGEVVLKYYEVREEMTPGENAIFEGLLNNPIFPIFTRVCQEKENEWLKNQGEEQESGTKTENTDSGPQPNHQPSDASASEERTDLVAGKNKGYQFKWPSWDEFNEKTIKGIPAHFDYITKHVAIVEQDFKTPEGYEHFKDFMNLVAEYGSIDNDADMKTLLQFVTGKAFDGAKMKIKWKADNSCGRILYFVVQWISNDNDKLAMVDRMTDFYYSPSVKDEDKDKGLSSPSVFLQGAKGIKDSVLKNLHFYYNIIPETREDAKKKRK